MHVRSDLAIVSAIWFCLSLFVDAHPRARLVRRVPIPQATPAPQVSPNPTAGNRAGTSISRIHALSPSEAVAALAKADQQVNGLGGASNLNEGANDVYPTGTVSDYGEYGSALSPSESAELEAEYAQYTSEFGAYDSYYSGITDNYDLSAYQTSLSPSEISELNAELAAETSYWGDATDWEDFPTSFPISSPTGGSGGPTGTGSAPVISGVSNASGISNAPPPSKTGGPLPNSHAITLPSCDPGLPTCGEDMGYSPAGGKWQGNCLPMVPSTSNPLQQAGQLIDYSACQPSDICTALHANTVPKNQWYWSSPAAGCSFGVWVPAQFDLTVSPGQPQCIDHIFGAIAGHCQMGSPVGVATVNLQQVPGNGGTGLPVDAAWPSYILAAQEVK